MSSRWAPAPVLALVLLLVACGGSSASNASPVGSSPTVASVLTIATLTPTSIPGTPTVTASTPPAIASTATVTPAIVAPTSTPVPPAPTSTPASAVSTSTGRLQFKPAQLGQGTTAVVYLNEPATSASIRFGGVTFPMLQDGNRWWAVIGVGAFANTGSAPVAVTYTSAGQTTTVSESIEIVKRDYPVSYIQLDSATASLLAPEIVNSEIAQRTSIYSVFTSQRLWSGPFVAPNKSPISDPYGVGRSYNGSPVTDYHRGTDFAGQLGDPVLAAAAGRVVFAGPLKVRGNSVIVDNGAGIFTAYHHLSEIGVSQGQMVAAGQLVGKIGATGLVDGPVLHWEVIVHGQEVDGRQWLLGTELP